MGGHWGEMSHVRGIVQYSISPFEQKVFKGFFKKQFMTISRRARANFPYIAPGFFALYFITGWAEAKHKALHRKNPADYANDV
eukprot:Awhi_evm2s5394